MFVEINGTLYNLNRFSKVTKQLWDYGSNPEAIITLWDMASNVEVIHYGQDDTAMTAAFEEIRTAMGL